MIRKILLAAMIGTSAATVALPGIAADRVVYVQIAPPVIREEVVPAPRRGYAWAPGYWGWRHSKHVWVRGAWVRDRPGHHYRAATWREGNGRWVMQRGHWARGERTRGDRQGG